MQFTFLRLATYISFFLCSPSRAPVFVNLCSREGMHAGRILGSAGLLRLSAGPRSTASGLMPSPCQPRWGQGDRWLQWAPVEAVWAGPVPSEPELHFCGRSWQQPPGLAGTSFQTQRELPISAVRWLLLVVPKASCLCLCWLPAVLTTGHAWTVVLCRHFCLTLLPPFLETAIHCHFLYLFILKRIFLNFKISCSAV